MDPLILHRATPRLERWLRRVFTRPWLAALVVGTAIHGFQAFNQWYTDMGDYLALQREAVERHPGYGAIQLLIPYLIPWLVTSVGRHLAGTHRAALLAAFPEANPDLIIKLDNEGNAIYVNRAARAWLQALKEEKEEQEAIESILPENYRDRLAHEDVSTTPITLSASHGDREIGFSFRADPESGGYFVAGRDITNIRRANERLETANRRLRRSIDIFDSTLSQYDPLRFKPQEHYRRILQPLLRDPDHTPVDKPTHVFLAERRKDALCGHIYTRRGDTVITDPQEIHVAPGETSFAITWGNPEVISGNWQESGVSLAEFQQRFHPIVRKKVGTIEGFATYQSGEVALIAFYRDYRVEHSDALMLKGIAVFGNSLHRVAKAAQETEEAFIYTVEALARAAEANDEDTGEHIVRINEYSRLLAEAMGMDEPFVRRIHYSAQMHDVGKIHVHPDILKKPGKLSDEQFAEMQSHPLHGARILGDSERLAMAAEIALCHHEKFNGTGYPRGLKGEEIPISARIVALADVYDALRQKRVYKPAFSHEKAVRIITRGDGRTDPSDFDPRVLEAFRRVEQQMNEIFTRLQPTETSQRTE